MKAIWRGSLGVQLVAILLVAFLVTPALGGTLPPPSGAGTTTEVPDEDLSKITGEALPAAILAFILANLAWDLWKEAIKNTYAVYVRNPRTGVWYCYYTKVWGRTVSLGCIR